MQAFIDLDALGERRALPTKPVLVAAQECAQICEDVGLSPLSTDLRGNIQALRSIALDAPQRTATLVELKATPAGRLHLFWLHRDLATITHYVCRRLKHGRSSSEALADAYAAWLAPVHTTAMRLAFKATSRAFAPSDATLDAVLAKYAELDYDALARVLSRIGTLVPSPEG